jgi:hypothetical protein
MKKWWLVWLPGDHRGGRVLLDADGTAVFFRRKRDASAAGEAADPGARVIACYRMGRR